MAVPCCDFSKLQLAMFWHNTYAKHHEAPRRALQSQRARAKTGQLATCSVGHKAPRRALQYQRARSKTGQVATCSVGPSCFWKELGRDSSPTCPSKESFRAGAPLGRAAVLGREPVAARWCPSVTHRLSSTH